MTSVLAELHERGAGVGAESSTEDEASLSQCQLDLDLDCGTSFSEVDGVIPPDIPGDARGFSGASSTTEVVSIKSASEDNTVVSTMDRTVTGSEVGETNVRSSSEREVYGHESNGGDITERSFAPGETTQDNVGDSKISSDNTEESISEVKDDSAPEKDFCDKFENHGDFAEKENIRTNELEGTSSVEESNDAINGSLESAGFECQLNSTPNSVKDIERIDHRDQSKGCLEIQE